MLPWPSGHFSWDFCCCAMHCYECFGSITRCKKEKFVVKERTPSLYFGFSLLNRTRRTAFYSYVVKKKKRHFLPLCTSTPPTLWRTQAYIPAIQPGDGSRWQAPHCTQTSLLLYWVRTSPWVKRLLPGNFFLQHEKNPQRALIPYANRLLAAAPTNFANMPGHAWIFLNAKFRFSTTLIEKTKGNSVYFSLVRSDGAVYTY